MTAEQREESPPLEDLAGRFRLICESAVNPLEIASALEFDGISNRAAHAGYDVPDVFALARLLYAHVPRKPAARLRFRGAVRASLRAAAVPRSPLRSSINGELVRLRLR